MKKNKKFFQDYQETWKADTEMTISFWHIIAAMATIVLFTLTGIR